MSNHLIPEARVNKNGVSVIKHVLPGRGVTSSAASIPAPVSDGMSMLTTKDQQIAEVLSIVMRDARFDEDRVEAALNGLLAPTLEKMLELHERHGGHFDEYLQDTIERDERFVEAKIQSYEFCRSVCDSSSLEYASSLHSKVNGTLQEMFRRATRQARPTQFHIETLQAVFLMDELGFNDDTIFGVKADYYREMETLRANLEIIKPAIPLVFASSEEGIFDTDDTSYVITVSRFVEGKSESDVLRAADFVRNRREYDEDTIEVMLATESHALSDGVL